MTDGRPPAAIDPRISHAASVVRRLPLRWSEEVDGDRDAEQVVARGFFLGAAECARVLAAIASVQPVAAAGFGGRWPVLVTDDWMLAPAVPVAVGRVPVVGCDGEYHRRGDEIWREAVGVESLFLGSDPHQPPPGEPFDLLWFGDAERYLVRRGTLEVDDLFGRLSVPATSDRLERFLCRARRIDAEILSALPGAEPSSRQTVEVWRPAILSGGDRWRDPTAFFSARADIDRVRGEGARLDARTIDGEAVVFEVERTAEGWRVTLRKGRYPFTGFVLEHRHGTLVLSAALEGRVDALAPGVRGRLVFDLRSDLVTLD